LVAAVEMLKQRVIEFRNRVGVPETHVAKKCAQTGYVLVSSQPGEEPLFHGFHLTRLDAAAQMAETKKFPEYLRDQIKVVPLLCSLPIKGGNALF
jgi:hypothetical protein